MVRRVGQLSCSPVEPMVVAASAMAVVGKGAAVREGVLAGWNLRSMGAKVRCSGDCSLKHTSCADAGCSRAT